MGLEAAGWRGGAPASGWLAQWLELIDDTDQRIARPRQIYTGNMKRDYVPLEQRN